MTRPKGQPIGAESDPQLQPERKQDPQAYKSKESNSANNLNDPRRDPESQAKSPAL